MERKPGDNANAFGTKQTEEISLVEVANTILRSWRLVVVLPLLLATGVATWTLTRERTYAATASFVPQAADSRGGGAAAAIAEQFGVSVALDRPGQSPQFFVDLLGRQAILRQAVESEYVMRDSNGRVRTATLIEVFEAVPGPGPVPAWHSAVEQLRRNSSASVSRETGLISLRVSVPDPGLAEQVAQRLFDLLNEFNMEVRQRRAQEEGRFIAERLGDAEGELLAAEEMLKSFLRQNREFRHSPELVFEHDRLQRQVAMRQEVYTSLLRSREQVRIDAVRDTPLLTLIDQPAGTAVPERRGLVLRMILALGLGVIIAVFVTFLREYGRRSRAVDDPHYREFHGLARQAWEDLRRPARWVRRAEKPVAAGDV